MNIETIKLLIKETKYDEALSACQTLLKGSSTQRADVLRIRAYAYSHMGDYQRSIKDRKEILILGEGTLKDLYLAADNALNLNDFTLASSFLLAVLELGGRQNEHWFDSAAYFQLSYAQMELGNYTESLTNLKRAVDIEPNCSMPLPGQGMVEHERLKKEIIKRQSVK